MPNSELDRTRRQAVTGAAFLMATSAIGPGFLTQTAAFTEKLGVDFAFAILGSVAIDVAAQVNVWRVLGAAAVRGDALADALAPGLGRVIAWLVAAGGLVFNVGNVAGCALGLSVFGVPEVAGASLSAALAILLLSRPQAGRAMDLFVKGLGGLMLVLTGMVVLWTRPDLLGALRATVWPARVELLPIVTLVGGTVGGYITFSGVHRLLDAGVSGPEAIPALSRAAALGIGIAGVMRTLLFLAVLGALAGGGSLDPANPAASAFRIGAGEWGYRFFGVVLWSAAITSVVGCTYTSLSFLRGSIPVLQTRPLRGLLAFVTLSLVVYLGVGRPVRLLILAGALNGLILPATLGVVLLAARRPELLGGYRHPRALSSLGWLAWIAAVVAGLLSLGDLSRL